MDLPVGVKVGRYYEVVGHCSPEELGGDLVVSVLVEFLV